MIKLQDFARESGISDRQVQRLLKKYADDLEGHYERKGPNGTWLDEFACSLLRSHMRQSPMAIVEPNNRIVELEERVKDLEKKLLDKDKLVTMAQEATLAAQKDAQKLLEDARKVLALEEGKKALEAENEALKAENAALKNRSFLDFLLKR